MFNIGLAESGSSRMKQTNQHCFQFHTEVSQSIEKISQVMLLSSELWELVLESWELNGNVTWEQVAKSLKFKFDGSDFKEGVTGSHLGAGFLLYSLK